MRLRRSNIAIFEQTKSHGTLLTISGVVKWQNMRQVEVEKPKGEDRLGRDVIADFMPPTVSGISVKILILCTSKLICHSGG